MGSIEAIRWADFLIQAATFVLIIYGYAVFRWHKGLRKHAYAFTAATLLNLVTVLLIMVPIFIDHWGWLNRAPMGFNAFLLWTHHILGIVATALSVFIVVRWAASRGDARKCRGRLLMNATTVIWLATILIGFWFVAKDLLEP